MKRIIKMHTVLWSNNSVSYRIIDRGQGGICNTACRYVCKRKHGNDKSEIIRECDDLESAIDFYDSIIAGAKSDPKNTITEVMNLIDPQHEQITMIINKCDCWKLKTFEITASPETLTAAECYTTDESIPWKLRPKITTKGVVAAALEAVRDKPEVTLYPSYLRHHEVIGCGRKKNYWLEEIEQPDGTFKYAAKYMYENSDDEVITNFENRDAAIKHYDNLIKILKSIPSTKVEVGYYHHEEDKDAVIAGFNARIDDLVKDSKASQAENNRLDERLDEMINETERLDKIRVMLHGKIKEKNNLIDEYANIIHANNGDIRYLRLLLGRANDTSEDNCRLAIFWKDTATKKGSQIAELKIDNLSMKRKLQDLLCLNNCSDMEEIETAYMKLQSESHTDSQ